MAEPQRSFFEEDKKGRPPRYPYQKSNHIPPQSDHNPKHPPAVIAPIPASSASKSKLKNFKFQASARETKDNDIEFPKKAANREEPRVQDQASMAASQLASGPQCLSQPSQHKECPQTPVGRLPLAELIAAVDDNAGRSFDLTPGERVLWQYVPGSSQLSGSQPAKPPPPRKKRARSSSPSSSSQNEISSHFANKQPSDLQTLNHTLKTPKADPAADLWSRYSLKTGAIQDGSPTTEKISFMELLRSSSPQTPGSHLKTRELKGLRRSISCANEWPTSAAKRRRLNPGPSQGRGLDDNKTNGNENAKMSRMNILVEQVHNALLKNRPATMNARPSGGSSPSPEKDAVTDQSQSSPAGGSQTETDQERDLEDPMTLIANEVQAQAEQEDHLAVAEQESEFGDGDLDDDELLEAVDADMTPRLAFGVTLVNAGRSAVTAQNSVQHPPKTPKTPVPIIENKEPTSQDRSKRPRSPLRGSSTSDHHKIKSAPCENYDDDDDDIVAADYEDLVAVYDDQRHDMREQRQQIPVPQKIERRPLAVIDQPNASVAMVESRAYSGKPHVIDVSSDEEFGEEADFDDIVAQCTAASQSASQNISRRQRRTIQRYEITNVVEGQYTADNGASYSEKVLMVQPEKSKTLKAIILRESWIPTPCTPGSFVHVVGDFDGLGQCIIDDHHNLLILHPDHLISATVVGDSFSCTRRAVLQDRVKATTEANESVVYGHILHEIFEEAMKANRWDDAWLHETIEKVASRFLESFFEINLDPITAVNQLKSKAVALQAWAEIFLSARPKREAIIRDRNGATSAVSINKLLEVEEKVWSPMYGLKGNVDATVQIAIHDGAEEKRLTVPFELKTGKRTSSAHRAQTMLYTLLLTDRYDIEVACGILYYMDSSEISRIPAVRHELRQMIMQRNELAHYVRQRVELPPMLKSPHLCGNCYAQKPCFVYHKLVENGNGETSGVKDKFEELVQHLSPSHAEFFKKWDGLLTKEEKDIVKIRRELWTMQGFEREKVGRCFSNVIIESGSARELEDAPKINRYHYSFVKQKAISGFSFQESQITTGEPVVISDEEGHFVLASGYVTAVRKRRIDVAVDRRLNNSRNKKENFDAHTNQSFVGIMEVVEQDSMSVTRTPEEPQGPKIYRIDKDEFSNGMATVRNNLISLMEKGLFASQALRKLIVENVAPIFRPQPDQYSLGNTASQASLNEDQRNAVVKVLSAKDYALVLGMPGTGKTTTIAHLIRALTAQNKSVLLTSYTHTAVDNILLKIRHDNIGVFRLGALAKIHPEVQDFADLAGTPMKSIEEIKTAYSRPVVATTCLGINHPIFNQKVFDYCIVDEASQITLPVCLGPIRMARTFILVGDHNQLPPLVQNEGAREGGLDVSLFKILSDNHPDSVVNLATQYRMCEDIMALSNTLIYNGRLQCGSAVVAQASIRIPRMDALKQHHHTPSGVLSSSINPKSVCLNPTCAPCWIRDLLDPRTKACFVNTDPLLPLSRESETGSRIVNDCEATLCTQLVQSLLTTGVPAKDIGVITLYRSQLALIKQNLRHHHPAVEMYTADKFQGRDKEVIILSLVRSNESLNVGELLKDWRRVNVALTRARTKLLVLGSKSTLKGNEMLAQFVKLMDNKGWTYDLPRGAVDGHVFDDGATPSLTARVSSHEVKKEKPEVKKEPLKAKRIEAFFDKSKDKENRAPVKASKAGKMTEKALLGSRPVLRDIVNDASLYT